jgi:hypothetical protein
VRQGSKRRKHLFDRRGRATKPISVEEDVKVMLAVTGCDFHPRDYDDTEVGTRG